MIIIGIDPGASGAIAVRYTNLHPDNIEVIKLDQTETDIANVLTQYTPQRGVNGAFAYLESVHSMTKQWVASSFKFGQSYGFLRGLLIALKIPFETVTPQKWQKAMGCMSRGDKNVTKAKAQQLFTRIKVTHAIADALLLAEYGRRIRAGEFNATERTDDAI